MDELPPSMQATGPRAGERDIQRRERLAGLSADDLLRIVAARDLVIADSDRLAAGFFDTLRRLGDAAVLFKSNELLVEAKRLKREHIVAMVSGDYGAEYAEQRVRLGTLYSKAGLDVAVFLGAFQELLHNIGDGIVRQSAADPERASAIIMSLQKVALLDIGIIVDALISERERVITLQQEAIRELSTPVLRVRDRLLILPLVGMIDSQRAMQITDNLLRAIRTDRARAVVIDITGVAAVDSKVANHLLQTIAASQLMGAKVIVTGLSADVAQALVGLGIDLSKVTTIGDLQGGLEVAEQMLGPRAGQPIEASNGTDRSRSD
jgi:rsbT co-antagonist protein RsbR